MHPLARLDRRFIWHPFTQMRDWLRREPIVIVSGRGTVLTDAKGRRYLDANSSIWTNLHGHHHPHLDAAIRRQLGRIAHSSALGLANEPASRLAAQLVRLANPKLPKVGRVGGKDGRENPKPGPSRDARLAKAFFSDDGSTALEVALKMSWEYTRRSRPVRHPRFLSLEGAYHGDTIGAVALGHIDLFHKSFGGLKFKTDAVMAPYCYRCPFNRARPQRADARNYRECRWECIDQVERAFDRARSRGAPYAGFVVEPGMQGAAGMIPQPEGWLRRVAPMARANGALLIADEVMTGFGRTGVGPGRPDLLFATHREGVQPDILCLAKGLTGGYLPMAVTLTTQAVFDAFLGEYEEFRTFFHGHSYTANPLGAAASLASLELLTASGAGRKRAALEAAMREDLTVLWDRPAVGDVRLAGLIAGIELVRDWRTREPFDLRERAGIRVCDAMARRGVLTRPIGNVVTLMPPYCTTRRQLRTMIGSLGDSIDEVFGARSRK